MTVAGAPTGPSPVTPGPSRDGSGVTARHKVFSAPTSFRSTVTQMDDTMLPDALFDTYRRA